MPKTQKDLFYAVLEKISGEQGKLLRVQFEQAVAPNLKKTKKWDEPISDAEFAFQLKKMEAEIPAFTSWLMSQKFPAPPPSWTAQN